MDLTLTRVVFEFYDDFCRPNKVLNLTLTRVVFESEKETPMVRQRKI